MSSFSFAALRESLTPQAIADILKGYGAEVAHETPAYLIFRTCCHNLEGGSEKLYYYTDSHMFYCFTECGSMDIFTLLIKLEELRGNKVGLIQAIHLAGLTIAERDYESLAAEAVRKDLSRIHAINNAISLQDLQVDRLPILDPVFLDQRYTFSRQGTQPWIDEGISYISILEYGIRYDPINNCIIIPHYNEKDELIGVRARYFENIERGKYRPIVYNSTVLKHALSMSLYGLNQSKDAIKKYRKCIVFEGEKSVLKSHTIYGRNNVAVAVCGKSISIMQAKLLYDLGINEVVIAFDADYQTYAEMQKVKAEYTAIAEPLTMYFNTSIIIDTGGRLGYKDSPIDKGATVFNQLMSERIYV